MKLDRKSAIYSVITIIGSLAPLLVSGLLLFFNSASSSKYYGLIGKGEISIICIPIAISVMYSLYYMRQNRIKGIFDKYDAMFALTLIMFIVGIILYSFAANQYGVNVSTIEEPSLQGVFNFRLTIFSIIFLVWIFIVTYHSKKHEEEHVVLQSSRSNDQDNLESKVNNLPNE